MPSYLHCQTERSNRVSTLHRSRDTAEAARLEWEKRDGRRDIRMLHEIREAELDLGTGRVDGMQIFRDMITSIDLVNEHSYAFSSDQSEIIMMCMQAVLKQIFSPSELMRHLPFVLRYFGLNELFEDLIIQMRRRGGKTIVISCFIAVFAVCLPRANTNVFSTSARVSIAMKDVVRGVVLMLMKECERFRGYRIETDNKETLAIRTSYGTLNVINFFPSNPKIGATDPLPLIRRDRSLSVPTHARTLIYTFPPPFFSLSRFPPPLPNRCCARWSPFWIRDRILNERDRRGPV